MTDEYDHKANNFINIPYISRPIRQVEYERRDMKQVEELKDRIRKVNEGNILKPVERIMKQGYGGVLTDES